MEDDVVRLHEATRSKIRQTVDRLKSVLDERAALLISRLNKIEPTNDRAKQQCKETAAHFTWDESLEDACSCFGDLCVTSVSASESSVSGKGVTNATVDEAAVVNVQLVNSDGSRCTEDVPVSVTLTDAHGECIAKGQQQNKGCNSKCTSKNTVTFKYFPRQAGTWQLHVDVLKRPISGSPFPVQVGRPLRQHFYPVTSIIDLYRPFGLAISPAGELVVVENRGYSTISVYSSDLKKLRSFASWGSGEGQCKQPRGVCFDTDGNILVIDGDNHRLHKFSLDGKFLQTVGSWGFDSLQFLSPTSVACSQSGLVYVADRNNHRIQILRSSDLSFMTSFGQQGCGPGDLCNPWDVGIDSQGFVYVTDAGHGCIKKFTSHGEFKARPH